MFINLKILPQVGVTFSLIGVQVVQHLCGASYFMELIINSKKHGQQVVYYDDQDHELISRYNWHIQKGRTSLYAITNIKIDGAKRIKGKLQKTVLSMHRLVMGTPDYFHVDHKDHNGLNNRKCNLRKCTRSQNAMNSRLKKTNITGYKGVTFFKASNRYEAFIMHNKKQIHLGYFDTDIEAAKRYNEAAVQYFGEFAYLNKIQ